jgi:hypothetical protein
MARAKSATKPPVPQETIDRCLAKAIADGDIVNFRFLFLPFSPLRDDCPERIESIKYAYLVPEDEDSRLYRDALGLVKRVEMHAHVKAQLMKKGPAQLPSEMVQLLADNAVRLGKYTSAAQAYELIRIRRRMQEEFYAQADAALDRGEIPRAVRGYRIATGLEYDYAAFPEALPAVPNYHTRALMLHATYPAKPEDALAVQPLETHLSTALNYLLLHTEAAARIEKRPLETRLAFVVELVRQLDPRWDEFVECYRAASRLVQELGRRLERRAEQDQGEASGLVAEIETLDQAAPAQIPAALVNREIENGEWWQYLKELAYLHPAAVLFVARQAVSKDLEIILPRYVKDSELVRQLGLDVA